MAVARAAAQTFPSGVCVALAQASPSPVILISVQILKKPKLIPPL